MFPWKAMEGMLLVHTGKTWSLIERCPGIIQVHSLKKSTRKCWKLKHNDIFLYWVCARVCVYPRPYVLVSSFYLICFFFHFSQYTKMFLLPPAIQIYCVLFFERKQRSCLGYAQLLQPRLFISMHRQIASWKKCIRNFQFWLSTLKYSLHGFEVIARNYIAG